MIRLSPMTILNNQETIKSGRIKPVGNIISIPMVEDIDGNIVEMQYAKRPDGKYESVLEVKVVL